MLKQIIILQLDVDIEEMSNILIYNNSFYNTILKFIYIVNTNENMKQLTFPMGYFYLFKYFCFGEFFFS